MPSNDQPEWPSEDTDAAREENPADGGATAQLPLPGTPSLPESPTVFVPAPPERDDRTDAAADPPHEQATAPHRVPRDDRPGEQPTAPQQVPGRAGRPGPTGPGQSEPRPAAPGSTDDGARSGEQGAGDPGRDRSAQHDPDQPAQSRPQPGPREHAQDGGQFGAPGEQGGGEPDAPRPGAQGAAQPGSGRPGEQDGAPGQRGRGEPDQSRPASGVPDARGPVEPEWARPGAAGEPGAGWQDRSWSGAQAGPGAGHQDGPRPGVQGEQGPAEPEWARPGAQQNASGRPDRPQPMPPSAVPLMQPMRIEPSGEIHPAETTTGEEKPPVEAPAPPKRRRGRVLAVSALVLVLVVAVGVALATPYVSNRLALPWAPNRPKADAPEPVPVALSLKPPSSAAPEPTPAGVSAALSQPAGNGALGTLTGSVIDPANGQMLWDRNSGQLRTPASTTKLLTTAAALLAMDAGTQLSTKVVEGSSPDTAVLVAGGDVTLSSLPAGQQSVYPGAAHLDDLVAQVKQASGGSVKQVLIDTSVWTGAQTAPGWAPNDAPIFTAPMTPVMLDGGLDNPKNDHSVRVTQPANTVLQTFAQRLGATAAGPGAAPQDAKVLGEVKSAPLSELIARALETSDNTLAEAIGRMTAIATGHEPSFAGAAQATLSVLAQHGFDVSQVRLSDTSGLSPQNSVPAKLLAQILAAAAGPDDKDARTARLRPMLSGLPVAGGSGTLVDRYKEYGSQSGRGWVRAKTGTLSGVHTLAGVVLDADGRVLVFALMSDGADQRSARAALDVVAASLQGCGCR
ncbi:D-alanyl-D-alanine carboxypeptidase/D-alanyl-D-alanine endopeptidase [Amycolatopsis viridis]|uniref:D-alanyl-D-alanine carboxypeptidase/D-alanyl-D-alanine-endopeptidase (Penicillin-binding protein 4) n=1 Tax=Amycolatopsis viridis TaxID=185678 RepID=A0ABX0SMD6_9PSEU|nr:D-alanyl-D-alanine carboxypeptidase/D-alanyl-D-alanine-endopeptidase [Amycolatopsis viridis]NIH78136.1 D-alanyl-D-alanine carboxypeptidase/D-alanyl-D-alanine-endopeptidase (penicillin-binding protein 4) [Amycolatopsis viridis]